jgi:hypothetical protein
MARLRAAWVTQVVVGCAVAPRIRMRRVACSMTARTYSLAPVSVTVSMKPAASSAWACQRRKVAQVVVVRSGEASTPASRRICQTVEAATLTPRVSSSPCTRRYPQLLFSGANRSIRARIERSVRGRPCRRGRAAAAWRRASGSRCQRKMVSGRTSSRRRCRAGPGRGCSRAASSVRSSG